jgi:hypothetical protein
MQLRRDPETILVVLGTLGTVFFVGVALLFLSI